MRNPGIVIEILYKDPITLFWSFGLSILTLGHIVLILFYPGHGSWTEME
jgi:hypothetical protein